MPNPAGVNSALLRKRIAGACMRQLKRIVTLCSRYARNKDTDLAVLTAFNLVNKQKKLKTLSRAERSPLCPPAIQTIVGWLILLPPGVGWDIVGYESDLLPSYTELRIRL